MTKIVYIAPGQVIPNHEEPPTEPTKRIEIPVTLQPKTRAQRQMNDKAAALSKAQARQDQNAPAPRKLSKWQKKARRKRKREIYRLAAKADAARGSNEQN
jgi:hypothetical protein